MNFIPTDSPDIAFSNAENCSSLAEPVLELFILSFLPLLLAPSKSTSTSTFFQVQVQIFCAWVLALNNVCLGLYVNSKHILSIQSRVCHGSLPSSCLSFARSFLSFKNYRYCHTSISVSIDGNYQYAIFVDNTVDFTSSCWTQRGTHFGAICTITARLSNYS